MYIEEKVLLFICPEANLQLLSANRQSGSEAMCGSATLIAAEAD